LRVSDGSSTNRAAVGLGSNLGDREAHLRAALEAMGQTPGVRVVRVSAFVQTAAVGPLAQGPFLNAAAVIETTLCPRELLGVLQEIERSHGRDRGRETRWGPRTLDMDLLLFGDTVIDEPGLTVPHPRLHERAFALGPLAQIAPGWAVPMLGATVEELLRRLGV
jgi:2-amino-4-hydroxy-6-hydroxymethyldihydropteridine diphosphokinase